MQTSDYTLDLELHDGTEVIVKFDRDVDYDLETRTYFYTSSPFTVYDASGKRVIDLTKIDNDYIEDECDNYVREVSLDEDTRDYY